MNKPRRVNSYDVARLAGVSQSAVSRAFTPGASVSPLTREKVLAAARAIGYAPNAIARSLITQRSHIVAVVITDQTTRHYPDILIQLGSGLQQLNQHLLLFTVADESGLAAALNQLLQYQVDGIVSCVSASRAQARSLRDRGVPLVLLNRIQGCQVASVCCDHSAGGRRVAELLHAAGHRRYGFIGGPADGPVSAQRGAGFSARLGELGVRRIARAQTDYSYEGGYDCALRLMNRRAPPDAIFCANDSIALGALDALRYRLGLAVPEQVAVVGFDDIRAGARPGYRLTTVRQPLAAMTDAALAQLTRLIETPGTTPQQQSLPGELVLRESTRPVK